MPKAHYPADHKPAMQVPKGGSSCSKCEYLKADGKSCRNPDYNAFYGTDKLPRPADEFCSDWYEPKKKLDQSFYGK